MTTIKSYTDIEQSKKLAEILPLESADMYYTSGNEYDVCFGSGEYEEIADWYSDGRLKPADIPCWSLTALLDALPNDCGVNKEEDKFVASYLISDECGAYTESNPVDACYEMIIKLHELNLL